MSVFRSPVAFERCFLQSCSAAGQLAVAESFDHACDGAAAATEAYCTVIDLQRLRRDD